MFFSVITKNLNWEILTKNLVTFLKDGMGLRMKNFKCHEKPRGESPEKGTLESLLI